MLWLIGKIYKSFSLYRSESTRAINESEKAITDFAKEWRTFVDLGEINVNGTKGHQLECYFGSSTFDSKEMSVFLDGIISECIECKIDVKTPNEIKELKELWRIENE